MFCCGNFVLAWYIGISNKAKGVEDNDVRAINYHNLGARNILAKNIGIVVYFR
ncbi:MAG: hypothetical protein PWQ93_135 [Clostridiales bacterium]|nr:hypothetical protein [Clostridiales bacterium]